MSEAVNTTSNFDFTEYLANFDGGNRYTIHHLTGGLVNVTVRAVRQSPDETSNASTRLPLSVIAKYAPPYIASIGESAPFSQFRQEIEARALSLFTGDGPLAFSLSTSEISVPRLLHADTENHIILIEDLGKWSVLDNWLRTSPSLALCETLGGRLGAFLATVHSTPFPSMLSDFANPDMAEVVYTAAVQTTTPYLKDFGVTDAEELGKRTAEHFRSTRDPASLVFSVGDLWTASVLVSPDGSKAGVIDWEFAGPSPPLNDMAQLGAHLHLLLLTATPQVSQCVTAFVHALHAAYGRQSQSAPWMAEQVRRHHIRSAWILHGREIVNNAIERDWGADDATKKALVEKGAWYIRIAGASEGEMDWEDVTKEAFLGPLYHREE